VSDARKVDPFDVEALERAVNDSATRVSAIWISFLVFSLYLLIAATTVTQRQLLLAEPVKLPVLNIDLPLWGFFFLAPILFVILHAYVLLQVLLLGRTSASYNTAVSRAGLSPEENASLRQRLANTLFAQIFAGSPREREGFVGSLLRAIVWITLAIVPILILLAFQFSFLPYHSHIATWTHRLLILFELAAFFLIWPLALDARKDFQWPKFGADIRRLLLLPIRLFGPKRREEWPWLRQQAFPMSACVLFVLVSLSLATFPGEPHVNLLTREPLLSVQCGRSIQRKFNLAHISIDLRFDRLVLPQVDVVDDEKLAQMEKHTSERIIGPNEGERTQDFRGRDFNCSELVSADLRRVDLTDARLVGANLAFAVLDGATLDSAQLRGANLDYAQLPAASLVETQLQGALLEGVDLSGAFLYKAQLQGTMLDRASLHGAALSSAQLQGASLLDARLQGASIRETQLQGALADNAMFQGAHIIGANLAGASLVRAQFQGVKLANSVLSHADLSNAYVWHAKDAACGDALVSNPNPNPIVEVKRRGASVGGVPVQEPDDFVQATPTAVESFIEQSTFNIPDIRFRMDARKSISDGLDSTRSDTAEIEERWRACEQASSKKTREDFDRERAAFLRDFVCGAADDRTAIVRGIARNLSSWDLSRPDFSAELARGLLGEDGKECAATKDLDEPTRKQLRTAIAAASSPPATLPPKTTSPAR
jgi:uncharacterized protein YjbI with pentapeptide repeats